MKRFFTKTGIWLLAAAATIAVVLCVVSALGSGTGLLHNALGVIASPFRAAGSAVAGWVDGISDRFDSVEQLQEENDELRRKIAELEKVAVSDEEIEAEYKRISDAYNVPMEQVKGMIKDEDIKADLSVKAAMDLVKAKAVVKAD